MSTKPKATKKLSKKHATKQTKSASAAAIDQKRNDEQQYHAGGKAHDPHNRTQELIDSGDSDAGDIDEETRSASAPYNKTYGHHE